MKYCRPLFSLVIIAGGLSSCVGPVPNEKDLNVAYARSEVLAREDIAELNLRRSRGEVTPEEYTEQKKQIDTRVAQRANEMVLTNHTLVESQRKAVGLPTPDSPQDIRVPQAGSLSTGTTRSRFNDQGGAFDSTVASAANSSEMGFLPGGNIGISTNGFTNNFATPTTVAQTPTVFAAPPVTVRTGSAGVGTGHH